MRATEHAKDVERLRDTDEIERDFDASFLVLSPALASFDIFINQIFKIF